MLAIRLTIDQKRKMVRNHSTHMLKLVKKRLAKPENKILLDYFKNDKLIKEVLETPLPDLLALDIKIWTYLRTFHAEDDIKEAVQRTFSEKRFFDKITPRYNAYHLCDSIGLRTCPYCNIIPIPTVITTKPQKLVVRPPLDHFFANKLYPLLAISFYNLIPGCDTCNSRFKLAKPTHHLKHLNPYVGEFADECVFKFDGFKKIDDLLAKHTTKFDIRLENLTADARFDGNKKLFHLETMYAKHKEVARTCLVKSLTYSPAVLNSINSIAQSSDSNGYFFVFETNFELERLHEHPLSKLKRDVVTNYATNDLKTILKL